MGRLAIALAALLATTAASAQHHHRRDEGDDAAARFRRAVALTDERNYPAAMTEFQRVYELTRNPALLFNVSATYEAMGELAEALAALDRFEAEATPALRDARREELVAARARLSARTGTLVVAVAHPGLTVTVDGVDRPADAARAGMRVNAGPRRVGIAAPGFVPRERVVQVPGDARVVVDEPLTPTRSSVSVRCDVAGAEVRVDGVPVAQTPVTSPLDVAEGRHRVEVRRPGYRAYETEVDARGLGASIDVSLPWELPVDVRVGARLYLRVDVSDAVASIDGRVVDADGPTWVPPGEHALTVSRERYTSHTRTVTLAPGQTARVDVHLTPTAAYREEHLSRARRERSLGLGVTLGGLAVAVAGGVTALAVWSARNDTVTEMNALADHFHPTLRGGCEQDDCPAVVSRYESLGSRLDVQDVGIGLGLAFAAAGLATAGYGVWMLRQAPSTEGFTAAVGGRSVTLGWRF